MIDIKVIRRTSENTQRGDLMVLNRATVIALCDEVEMLQDLLGKANALCRIRQERIKELEKDSKPDNPDDYVMQY